MSKATKPPATKPGHDPAPAGADNNTRLAFLEAGASVLAIAVADVIGAPMQVDSDQLFERAVEQLNSKATLTAEIDKLAGYLTQNHAGDIEGSAVDTAVKVLDQAKANASMLVIAMCGAGVDVPDVADPFPIAVAQFEALEDASAHGSGEATVGEIAAIARAEAAEKRVAELEDHIAEIGFGVANAEIPEPEAPREAAEAGPTQANLSVEDLKGLIEEGAAFELVFSDGTSEIIEIEPVKVGAGDLVRHGQRFMVAPAVLIAGPRGETAGSIELAGAALLHAGEQVGFCGFERPITLEPGEQRQFHRAFLFG